MDYALLKDKKIIYDILGREYWIEIAIVSPVKYISLEWNRIYTGKRFLLSTNHKILCIFR